MKAICKSCAISPGTLYHHFISKEALIQAIILQDRGGRWPVSGNRLKGFISLTIWSSLLSLSPMKSFGQRALVVEIMAEGMRNPQVAAMLKK